MLYKHGIIFRMQQCSTVTKHHQSEVASPMGHTRPPQGTSRTIDITNMYMCRIYEHASAYIYWCLHDHRMHVSYADGLTSTLMFASVERTEDYFCIDLHLP